MTRTARKRHVQLTIESAIRELGRGGPRRGSGRPKGRKTVSHDTRPSFAARYPAHVTLRIVAGVDSLAREHVMKFLRRAIRAAHKPGFRIVEFNVLTNHLHLVVEAAGAAALARGLQGFCVRVARRVNRLFGRTGKLFATRYHARVLKTPREVRNALRYVLLNRKHHAAEKKFGAMWIDPCSSAAWFTGWASAIRAHEWWKRELVEMEAPNARPTVWLLTSGWWQKHGRLRFDEAPAEVLRFGARARSNARLLAVLTATANWTEDQIRGGLFHRDLGNASNADAGWVPSEIVVTAEGGERR